MTPVEASLVLREEAGLPSMVIALRAIVYLVSGFTLLVCSTRLYLRKFVIRSFGLDDYVVVVALFLVLGFATLSIVISYYGIGRRQTTVSNEDLAVWLKIYYVAVCTYLTVASAVKTSLVVFIMRVFPQRYIQIIGWSMIAFMLAFSLSGEVAFAFQCTPVRAAFDKAILITNPNAKCYSSNTMFGLTMYQGVIMFVCDVIIIILPMPSIWALQLPMKKRFLLLGMFSFGFVACIASLVRFSTLVYTKDETDYTYSAAISLIWMNLEFNLGLVSGSLSSLRQIFNVKSIFSTQENSSKRAYELGSRNSPNWKSNGIMKTSEVITVVEEGKNESQERIVHNKPSWDI